MHEFHDADDPRVPQPSTPDSRSEGSPGRLREVGELHFHAASYASAVDYFRSALRALRARHSVQSSSREQVLELQHRVAECRRLQGMFPEALQELEDCAELSAQDPVRHARVMVSLARVRQAQGEHRQALELAREAFSQLSLTDHHRDVGVAQIVMGISHASMGHPRKAEEFFQDALATWRRIGDTVSQAHVLNNLAIVAKGQARWNKALQLYERAEALLGGQGAATETIALQLNKAILFRKMGRRAEALASAVQGNRGALSRGDQAFQIRFSLLLGQIYTEEGRFPDAEESLLKARVNAERQGMSRELALVDEFLGDLMRALGRFEQAALNYELAEGRALAISDRNDVLAEVRRRQAELAIEMGDPVAALDFVASGLVVADACEEEYERGFLLLARGQALLLQNDSDAALESMRQASGVFRSLRLSRDLAQTLTGIASLHLARGGADPAVSGLDHFVRARAALREAAALEDEAGRIDRCAIQMLLARTEMALGNHDDALLGLFELERMGCCEEVFRVEEVEQLRHEIESRMASSAHDFAPDFRLLASLPEMIEDDDFIESDALGRVLEAVVRRLGASRATVVLRHGRGKGRLEVLATHDMSRSLGRGLGQHALKILSGSPALPMRVWSDVGRDADWSEFHDAGTDGPTKGPLSSAVAFRAVDEVSGVESGFYFDADLRPGSPVPFSAESLAVATTLVELLRSAVFRMARGSGTAVDARTDGPWAEVITQSDQVMHVLELCTKVASSPYTVMLEGETGTGKGLLAKLIHELSPRRDKPLVSVNCAAIPEGLLESELFGHVKGAFTGAEHPKPGLILAAEGGTLFLDEVGKMPLPMQAKLLQFLDDHHVRPVGGTTQHEVNVRVLCASKRDLQAMVRGEEFLEDLYYRLLDFPIVVPPLRARGGDVELLAEVFVERAAHRLDREPPRMTRSAVAMLRAYRWPGNVRELEKVMTRAVLLASDDDRIRDCHLPAQASAGSEPIVSEDISGMRPLREQIAELERNAVRSTLEETGWNRSEAARRLKISYPTLLQKIRLYKLKQI